MRELSSRKSKAGGGLVERKKKEENVQSAYNIKGETPARTSPAHKPHISLCGFYFISSFQFHTDKDEGIWPPNPPPVRAAHRLPACRFENKKKVLQ